MSEVLERVRTFSTSRNVQLPDQLQQRIIGLADVDRNARLNYNEFVRLVRQTHTLIIVIFHF